MSDGSDTTHCEHHPLEKGERRPPERTSSAEGVLPPAEKMFTPIETRWEACRDLICVCSLGRSREPRSSSSSGRSCSARGGGLSQSAIHHGAHYFLSTFRRQAGILVGVNSVLHISLLFGDFIVPGPDRMDNLLKVQI